MNTIWNFVVFEKICNPVMVRCGIVEISKTMFSWHLIPKWTLQMQHFVKTIFKLSEALKMSKYQVDLTSEVYRLPSNNESKHRASAEG